MFVVPFKPLHPSLMFGGKVRSLPYNGATFKCAFSGRLQPYQNILDKARDKHSSLLQASKNFSHIMFFSLGLGVSIIKPVFTASIYLSTYNKLACLLLNVTSILV